MLFCVRHGAFKRTYTDGARVLEAGFWTVAESVAGNQQKRPKTAINSLNLWGAWEGPKACRLLILIGSSGRTRTYNPSVNSRILVTLQTQGLQALVARPSCVLSALRQEGRQQTRGGANEQKGYSGTTDVQNAHRFAAIGIALRHSGHFFDWVS